MWVSSLHIAGYRFVLLLSELLESLTAEVGEEFNILEYADPELASLNDAEHILDGLELAEDGMAHRHAKREPPISLRSTALLLESLTAEIGEEFNILEYADPELASLNDAEHILDGLELAEDGMADRHAKREPPEDSDQKQDNKLNSELQKAVKNIENKTEMDSELTVKSEGDKEPGQGQMFREPVQRLIAHSQIMQQQMQAVKSEVKLEGEDQKPEGEWRAAPAQRTVFGQMFANQPPRMLHQQINLQV
ncbi:unnamed protein product [Plutella xylostella]|uniref:(diamondback moth) hypothetical protein n=1 Tax=Plutella xylostella TaxID=51655 RepID=A0A8S4FV03_PLUXY|nr:unnamed protein product [Plutella xylostella]